ncbi:FAS1-like dehydratase domain-containing protein [Mycobacterium branderi]|uniref:Acyl dehydratase n=1 Tax=Mycobacterium branderi TaxID=43348 RepID=A0A7I7WFS3_9MYCO|nr:MaoC family dehydratase N-terminal domain-containing protein [Mycobacterium branderi]MCV7234640.1 MaoC family dehydratase N-terminal domain-containing protein [Mycobacterium branderi]ORA33176.1 acyl dehydratase [Mycobacterium branderi]BBZ15431.1 acyl dehydratase [Mycobacterium branderi]
MTQEITVDIDDDEGPRFATITDDAVERLRRAIGVPIADTVEPWCYEATRDNIRHYAHGIGDDNPLWCDPEYANTGPYGTLIAPPSFVFALSRILSGYVGGLPGIHAMWAGADLHWHQPIRRGTEVNTKAWLKDLIEHQTRFAGRAFRQIYHVELSSSTGELLCEGDSWCFRTERDTARLSGTKYDEAKSRPPARYSEEDLREIFSRYDDEVVRGSQPRYFEDVQVGDRLPTMVKGPMTVTGFIAYAQGWGGLYIRANKLAYKQMSKHPGLGIPNRFGIPDVPERVHWEDEFARAVGTPGAYDYGPERCSWLIHQLTNWIGDDGFVVKHSSQIRHHNVVGDWIRIEGSVTAVDHDGGDGATVTVTQRAYNQHDELSASGTGVVRLPRRRRG